MLLKDYNKKKLYIDFDSKGAYEDVVEITAMIYPKGVDVVMDAMVAFGKMIEHREDMKRVPVDFFWKIIEFMFQEENEEAISNFREPKYMRGGYAVRGPLAKFEDVVMHVNRMAAKGLIK